MVCALAVINTGILPLRIYVMFLIVSVHSFFLSFLYRFLQSRGYNSVLPYNYAFLTMATLNGLTLRKRVFGLCVCMYVLFYTCVLTDFMD